MIRKNNSYISSSSSFKRLNNYLGVQKAKQTQDFPNNLLKLNLADLGFDLQEILFDFFELTFEAKLLGILEGSLNSNQWKGISSLWQLEEVGQEYKIKLDRDLILLFLSTFGVKENDRDFSFSALTEIEREIIQGFFSELINKIQTLDLNESKNNSKLLLIWFVKRENLTGKVAIEFPKGILERAELAKLSALIDESETALPEERTVGLEKEESEEFFAEENQEESADQDISEIFDQEEDTDFDLEDEQEEKSSASEDYLLEEPQTKENLKSGDNLSEKIIFDANLIVGFSKMTLKEIYALETGDLVLLEESDRNNLYLQAEKEQKLFEVPVEFEQSRNLNKINLLEVHSKELTD